MNSTPPLNGPAEQPRRFLTTRWSIVLSAGNSPSTESAQALQILCHTYWYPLYAFARRQGSRAEEAADQTQEFFARLLEHDFLLGADQQRGRFRTYLLTLFKRFLVNEHVRSAAQKRGGDTVIMSLDLMDGENRYLTEPVENWTAEKLFERRWALTLLDHVMNRLEGEYVSRGKQRLFSGCKQSLIGVENSPAYAPLAAELDMSETAIRVAVHRMRQRYRELLHDEIRQTVASSEEVEDELSRLREALQSV